MRARSNQASTPGRPCSPSPLPTQCRPGGTCMTNRPLRCSLAAAALALLASAAMAQDWSGPIRGSWVREEGPQAGDVVLAGTAAVAEIIAAQAENAAVKQAAEFLAGDIEKIT